MAYVLKGFKAGRSWTVDQLNPSDAESDVAVSQAERTYIIERGENDVAWSAADEKTLQTVLQLLPKIGDAHSATEPLLICTSIRFTEGTDTARLLLYATVSYSRQTPEEAATTTDPACMVEQWGWHSASVQRDLMDRGDGSGGAKPILNSAGYPFDSVPQVDHPAPTFIKVFKTKSRLSGVLDTYAKVNDDDITIGDIESSEGMLRVVQADEERIFADPMGYKYRYTISLQRMSNLVKVYMDAENPRATTELGWDVAVADMGTLAKKEYQGGGVFKMVRLTDKDEEGNEYPVTMPVPLDGAGERLAANQEPISLWFEAYERVAIPAIFYSEPS